MSKCGKCEFEENHDCEFLEENKVCSEKYEISFCAFQIKQTISDKIRSMSDDELSEFLRGKFDCCGYCDIKNYENCTVMDCEKSRMKWLQSEVLE